MKFLVQLKDDVSLAELNNGSDDRSENEGDTELLQLDEQNQNKLFALMDTMDRPESLELVSFRPWAITDADGDGVEDNVHKDQYELDKFRVNYFFPLEDLHNTHHMNLPGHVQKEFELKQSAPADTYTLVKRNWNRFGN